MFCIQFHSLFLIMTVVIRASNLLFWLSLNYVAIRAYGKNWITTRKPQIDHSKLVIIFIILLWKMKKWKNEKMKKSYIMSASRKEDNRRLSADNRWITANNNNWDDQ